MAADERSDSVSTVEKAIDVLFHLHAQDAAEGVTAIGRALGLPKSSTHRLLSALGHRGLVERDDRGRYRPGMALVALGLGVLEREPIVAAARPILEARAAELGETFFLVSARAGELVVLDKAEGTGFLRAAPQVGSWVPSHATAVGKLYHAFAPDQIGVVPHSAVAGKLERFTAETLTTADALATARDEARRQGYALNRDEWIEGLSVLAAPVWVGERMVGTVAMAAASPRLSALLDESGPSMVIEAATDVGDRLAGRIKGSKR